MTYDNFSTHAPTGYSAKTIVTPNEYTTAGREIGYPSKFDVYVRKISNIDGSQGIQETRQTTDLIGSRLYLYHRPLTNADGTISEITVSDGTIDTTATNARQGYIVFTSNPSAQFTITYTAAADCESMWYFNTMQDSIMEIEKVLGPTLLTGYPGLRNLSYGLFNHPNDDVVTNVAQNAVYLEHLNRDFIFGSSNDPTVIAEFGATHTIQIGRDLDIVNIETTGLTIRHLDTPLTVHITQKTGDQVLFTAPVSGAGPFTIGGPEYPNYSGVIFSGVSGDFYTGAMLRVHGDVAVMGGIQSVGAITVLTATGETSVVLGDWTVRDELFVYGTTHLVGFTETNELTVQQNLNIERNIIASDIAGAGGGGQSLVDNLDCSEVAYTYQPSMRKIFPNSVVKGPIIKTVSNPKKTAYTVWGPLDGSVMVGDHVVITGSLNATAGPSGAHPAILQLLMNVQMVTGFYNNSGTSSGTWSPGMIDPGSAVVEMLDGTAAGFRSPIYSYTVEQVSGNDIRRLNVFCPTMPSVPPAATNNYILYNPGNVPYSFIYAQGGANPAFTVSGSSSDPLVISFDDHVRLLTAQTANISLTTALEYSVSGIATEPRTGVAYIVADNTNTDPEGPPIFRARPVPYRMLNETVIGEVVASFSGTDWSILETISYRPNGTYDSSWIPILQDLAITSPSGRVLPGFTSSSTAPLKVYFSHDIGPDIDMSKISAQLYLARPSSNLGSFTKNMVYMNSMFGQDVRNSHGLSGAFIQVPLGAKRVSSATTERDASIFYLDSKLIGVDLSPDLMDGFPLAAGTTSTPNYIRLVINRES